MTMCDLAESNPRGFVEMVMPDKYDRLLEGLCAPYTVDTMIQAGVERAYEIAKSIARETAKLIADENKPKPKALPPVDLAVLMAKRDQLFLKRERAANDLDWQKANDEYVAAAREYKHAKMRRVLPA
jgi:hypothetical protein